MHQGCHSWAVASAEVIGRPNQVRSLVVIVAPHTEAGS